MDQHRSSRGISRQLRDISALSRSRFKRSPFLPTIDDNFQHSVKCILSLLTLYPILIELMNIVIDHELPDCIDVSLVRYTGTGTYFFHPRNAPAKGMSAI